MLFCSYMGCILRLSVSEGHKAVSEVSVVLNIFIWFVDTFIYLVDTSNNGYSYHCKLIALQPGVAH